MGSSLRRLALALALALAPAAAWTRDAFVMLSGGASPIQNNYSQYVQARAVASFFEENYPADSVWIFFGAGNVEGETPSFGDVRRQTRKDGLVLESWTPGALKRNRPAKREVILKALREEILPAVHDGGTLFLFVGDHGLLSGGERPESAIDLWGVDPDPSSKWRGKLVDNERLRVGELQKLLADGLGRGRVVFAMTQCFSGGFHFLGIPREVAADPAWFAGKAPAWAAPARDAAPLPLAAGYTATDHYSFAAGCVPDPDPERWAGYERFLPENLLGIDLFTLQPAGTRRNSFYAAHVEATLEDRTVDKPQATSERYLERWATLIETRLAKAANLSPRVRAAVATYRRAVDTGKVGARDAALRERRDLFARFTQRLVEQAPTLKNLLTQGTLAQLGKTAGPLPPAARFAWAPAGTHGTDAAAAERRKLWREVLLPAWKEEVLAGKIRALEDLDVLAFEKVLIAADEKGRELVTGPGWYGALLPYLFSASAAYGPVGAARAEPIARWGAQRRGAIIAWARASESADSQAAAEKVFPPPRRVQATKDVLGAVAGKTAAERARSDISARPIAPKTAAERVLFYRRVLAAWAFLLEVKEERALAQVKRLTALERTPLPHAHRG
jgi:hypothetical protein